MDQKGEVVVGERSVYELTSKTTAECKNVSAAPVSTKL
jgi:hypothetical protein